MPASFNNRAVFFALLALAGTPAYGESGALRAEDVIDPVIIEQDDQDYSLPPAPPKELMEEDAAMDADMPPLPDIAAEEDPLPDPAPAQPDKGLQDNAPEVSHTLPASPKIEVTPTEALSSDSIGLLHPDQGLSANLWAGSRYTSLVETIKKIPYGIGSPALREELSRALLAEGAAPEKDASDADWVAARAQALIAIGEENKALELVDAVPNAFTTPAIAESGRVAHLLKGESEAACTDTQAWLEKSDRPFWQMLSIFCQAKAGRAAEAQLGLDAWAEQNKTPGPWFQQVILAMKTGEKKIADYPDTLSDDGLGMLISGGINDFPRRYLDGAPLAALRTVAQSESFPLEARTIAMEKLVMNSSEPAADLAALYRQFSFGDKERAAARHAKFAPEGVAGSALLYTLQAGEEDRMAKNRLIAKAFARYHRAKLSGVAFKLYADDMLKIAEYAEFPEGGVGIYDVLSSLLYTRHYDQADAFLARLPHEAGGMARSVGTIMVTLARGNLPDSLKITMAEQATPDDRTRLARLLVLLESLGVRLNSGQLALLSNANSQDSPALLNPSLIERLYATGSSGEKIILIAQMLEGGMRPLPASTVIKAVQALENAGLRAEAVALAGEAMLLP